MRLIKLVPGESFLFGSGKPYDLLAGASNYRNLVKNGDLEAYVYGSAAALLASGQAERGDVIFVDKGPDAPARRGHPPGLLLGAGGRQGHVAQRRGRQRPGAL